MLRRTLVAAGVMAAACIVTPIGPVDLAIAAVETCHGEEATIVGAPQMDDLRGTPARDVIVTNGSFEVQAGAGDDLICVTGGDNASIYAGPGDDVVDASTETHIWTELGPGADTFQGGTGPDTVYAGDARDDGDQRDADRDVISTGRGEDLVVAGEPDVPLTDQVDTGRGSDLVSVVATLGDGAAALELGRGEDHLTFDWPQAVDGTWLFDNGAGALTRNGAEQLAWAGAERFSLPDLRDNPVTFHGSSRRESVSVGKFDSVELRGGDDELWLRTAPFQEEISRAGAANGGAGRDALVLQTFDDAFVDLARGIGRFAEYNLGDVGLTGVENLTMYGYPGTVIVRGSAVANVVRSEACRQTVTGGAGDDHLISTAVECFEGDHATLRGGPGADLLRGAASGDRLSGGPGSDTLVGRGDRDVANGGAGPDTCQAEVRRSCSLP